jgi:hypothetical protein
LSQSAHVRQPPSLDTSVLLLLLLLLLLLFVQVG